MPVVYAAPAFESESYTGLKTTVSVEKWRCIAYVLFWTMVLFAIAMTKLFVISILAAGPDPDTPLEQKGCGPFNRVDHGFGVGLGQGFNYNNETHLQELFGYPNVCAYWDYSPSREATAMYFPFFEYALVIYLILDIVNIRLSHKRGEVPNWFWTFSLVVFWISVILCIWFRMIFIFIAYDDVQRHTAAFLGLQVALVLVAFQNTFYVVMTGQSYPTIGLSANVTKCVGVTYLILLVAISLVKMYGTFYIVMNGVGPDFYKEPSFIPGVIVGVIVDKMWMLFNAVLPFVIAVVRARNEDKLEIEVTCPKPSYEGETGETEPLVA